MSEYIAKYEKQFTQNLKRYSSLKQRIKRCVDRMMDDPYSHTELLGDISGKLNLKCSKQIRSKMKFSLYLPNNFFQQRRPDI